MATRMILVVDIENKRGKRVTLKDEKESTSFNDFVMHLKRFIDLKRIDVIRPYLSQSE